MTEFVDTGMLTRLGMSDLAEQVYLTLLNGPVDSAVEIAARLRTDLPAVRHAVLELEANGLVRTSSSGTGGLRAAPPDLAIDALLLRRLADLQRARLRLTDWTTRNVLAHERTASETAGGTIFEAAVGGAAITEMFLGFQASAQREIRAFDSPPYSLQNDENYTELDNLERGVAYRVVYDRRALELPHAVSRISAYAAAGEQARVAAGIPLKLGVADRKLVMLQQFPDPRVGEPRAVLVRGASWVDVCLALFNEVWERAVPLLYGREHDQASDPTAPSPEDIHMLSLLLSGLPDKVVASQIGVSPRTIQRRLRSLMDLSGTQTRMQLAWYAANHGWL
jgi:sugar-specific transcriptional regulator TrmB/DNA-binding CsgD family transcriptional regulator